MRPERIEILWNAFSILSRQRFGRDLIIFITTRYQIFLGQRSDSNWFSTAMNISVSVLPSRETRHKIIAVHMYALICSSILSDLQCSICSLISLILHKDKHMNQQINKEKHYTFTDTVIQMSNYLSSPFWCSIKI